MAVSHDVGTPSSHTSYSNVSVPNSPGPSGVYVTMPVIASIVTLPLVGLTAPVSVTEVGSSAPSGSMSLLITSMITGIAIAVSESSNAVTGSFPTVTVTVAVSQAPNGSQIW